MAATILGTGALDADALKRANVNPATGLATDYLNHFNEAVMLIEMAADMPDLAEDVLAWAPCAYEDHFERTGYTGRDVAVAAWRAAPRAVRGHFETLVARDEVEPLLAAARACINGGVEAADVDDSAAAQAGVDALFG